MRAIIAALLVTMMLGLAARQADAVALYSKQDRNTRAPQGTLTNSGWQWQGQWGNFLGTVISRKFFITAEHIGGRVGDYFTINGKRYKTLEKYDDPRSDLQMWKVHGQFDSYAPMFKENSEAGRWMMTYGRGTQRGGEVRVGGQLKGWMWGANDHAQSWGRNVIAGLASGSADEEAGGGKITDARFYWTFDRNGVSHEGALSAGDSGGGVFVKTGSVWRLTGVNHTTEAEFLYPDGSGAGKATIFDAGGLKDPDGKLITDRAADIPARSYATRISTRVPWIYDVLAGRVTPALSIQGIGGAGVPEPNAIVWVLAVGMSCLSRTCRR